MWIGAQARPRPGSGPAAVNARCRTPGAGPARARADPRLLNYARNVLTRLAWPNERSDRSDVAWKSWRRDEAE